MTPKREPQHPEPFAHQALGEPLEHATLVHIHTDPVRKHDRPPRAAPHRGLPHCVQPYPIRCPDPDVGCHPDPTIHRQLSTSWFTITLMR